MTYLDNCYYCVPVYMSLVKREIQSKVLTKLLELGVLELSSTVDTTVASGAENVNTASVTSAAELAEPKVNARATLPHFDPFSPSFSPGSSNEASATVHIA